MTREHLVRGNNRVWATGLGHLPLFTVDGWERGGVLYGYAQQCSDGSENWTRKPSMQMYKQRLLTFNVYDQMIPAIGIDWPTHLFSFPCCSVNTYHTCAGSILALRVHIRVPTPPTLSRGHVTK